MHDDSDQRLRIHYERQAATLFAATALTLAIAAGAMLVAGWSGGQLDNRIETFYWAGAVLAAAGVAVLAVAACPGGVASRGPVWRIRFGVALFLVGPVLCVTAVFGDYWI